MSKIYKSSEKLKKEILFTAIRFFMEYGYDGTTYQMIADELGISKSAISYHFKAKALIPFAAFEEYMRVICSFIYDNLGEGFNYYLYHCSLHIFVYRKILKSNRNRALFYHRDIIALWETEKIGVIENYFRQISDDFKKDFTDEEIHITAVMNLGAKASILREFSQSPNVLDIDKYCYYLAHMLGLFAKLDEATISKNIKRAFEFIDSHSFPDICLFD